MLRDGALSRPTKYLMLQDEALWRATEYLLQLRKYYDGRQSTSAFCASIVTNDRIPYAAEWSTMTADKVHYTTAETLRRPTEYFRILRKHRDGRQSARYYRKEYSHSRQNTLCCRMEYYDSRQSTLYNCGNTPTADRVLPQFAQAS
jgi:hypothetical protein